MANIWFTSDTHFGHKNINRIAKRPFTETGEMDEAIISNWNNIVGRDDTVYHLGDFGLANINYLVGIRNRLKGKIILIEGNHDKKNARKFKNTFYEYYEYWHWINIDNKPIMLCHYPILSWDRMHHIPPTWHLYGHVHGKLGNNPNSLSHDVGVDNNNFTPISWEQIKSIMATRTFVPVDLREKE